MWLEIGKCFEELDADENCRVVVLSGAGKVFTAGLDFQDMLKLAPELAEKEDVARKAKILLNFITTYQKSITSLELCRKPVLAAIHSACVGGGVDFITAADMRYSTKDAWFQVKEVDIGMAADVGTLQRLPKVIGSESLVRELCYTARKMLAAEALTSGLVSRLFGDKERLLFKMKCLCLKLKFLCVCSMIKGVIEIAEEISKKSPVAVRGTKVNLIYSRDHSVQEGLNHIALLNQMMLQSEDFATATVAQATKQKGVVFSKL
ncbi:delta(3,5)-Delta(2,4)-dienoyl-CoA isomerase, mitochondrial [Asbolus verrucosus]|uniref:Delta(3,5)-Delta(2,4)-dienoyl-CoA isomerase, mitochondrial n=1 Tax=Asbolus verrucosus TaxID=1661398 RepID=A0A482W9Z6_ASBVE|nr:delta(3,5)-Delta(2,4)-dienoyl-CoA isomerase, mitochondrial [Asbolus verrucosus]